MHIFVIIATNVGWKILDKTSFHAQVLIKLVLFLYAA